VSKKVFGYFPSPQILNELKSLYQSLSGASGSESLRALSWQRSSAVIFRIAGTRQAVSQLKEAFPFLLAGLHTGLDEINNDAVGARVAGLRQGFHPAASAAIWTRKAR
jgi:hypothetical protein